VEQGLQDLGSIEHVGAAFVCDNAGEVLAASTPHVLATVTMSQIGRTAAQILSAMEAARRRVDQAELAYDTWRLFVRDLGPGLLVVVSEPGVDTAFLRMEMDVLIAGWLSDRSVRKRLERGSAAVRSALVSPVSLGESGWHSWNLLAAGS
jgi:hypothetical protein